MEQKWKGKPETVKIDDSWFLQNAENDAKFKESDSEEEQTDYEKIKIE